MSGNRPAELAQRIDELEATVRGLTQELVEANERIRVLEEQMEAAESADRPISTEDGETNEEKTTDGEEEEAEETEDDIIVA